MFSSKIDTYKRIFQKFDRNNDGHLDVNELKSAIRNNTLGENIPEDVVTKIMDLGDQDGNNLLSFEEFLNVVEHPELQTFFSSLVKSYMHFILPPQCLHQRRRDEESELKGGDEVDGSGAYDEQYSCKPPRLGMIIITVVELILFAVDAIRQPGSQDYGTGDVGMALYFNYYRRRQVWRYCSYMFVHIGYSHLLGNCLLQCLVGLPLEMVHGSVRVLLIYVCGVLGGSLFTSIADPGTGLAGASGGGYAVITAHIATVVMNWSEMKHPLIPLGVIGTYVTYDFGTALWYRYSKHAEGDVIGYESHLAGAFYGVFVGIIILKNLIVKKHEEVIWWVAVFIVVTTMCGMIIQNVVYLVN